MRNCVCDECNQTYINADQLNEHIKENHFKYTYNCNVGGEGFSQNKISTTTKRSIAAKRNSIIYV